jgi:hypothetical protein
MRLMNRVPRILYRSVNSRPGLEHLRSEWIAIVRWLNENKVEYVLIGAVAEAIRGNARARGPLVIVPAPYRRNLERLARALSAEHARERIDMDGQAAGADPVPVKLSGQKLAERTRWTLRCGSQDIDVECGVRDAGGERGVPSYQELLYEAGRFKLDAAVSVEVASPEDIQHFAHLHRTGVAPEIRITKQVRRRDHSSARDHASAPDDSSARDGSPAPDESRATEKRDGTPPSAA